MKCPAVAGIFGLVSTYATMFGMDLGQFFEFSLQNLTGRRRVAPSCRRTVFGGPDQAKSRAGAFSDLRSGMLFGAPSRSRSRGVL